MRGITKRFPGVLANDRVDFEAAAGEVHALLGENGAGKTTLSNILTGLYRPDEGEIELYGRPVEFRSPRDALEAGIGMVHQHFRLVTPFTVAENIVLGDHRDEGGSFLLRQAAIERRVIELGARYRLAVHPRVRVWQLSVGEQQRVEILKALYREARILILDEPTAVLTPQEADSLFETLRAMAAEGRTVIFISHKLNEVMAVADRVTVLRGGRNVATVPIAEATPRSLAALMVGREVAVSRRREREQKPRDDVVLEVDRVSAQDDRGGEALKGVSLRIRAGEILAIAAVAGNGQRELAEVIAGMRPRTNGEVRIGGRPQHGHPWEAIGSGLAYIPEERMGVGVAPGLTIADNLILKSYRDQGPVIRSRETAANATQLIERFRIAARGPKTLARELSGGNIQRVLLARELSGHPKVLVAASPTRGLDVAATDSVRRTVVESANAGLGVLLISEDLDELLDLADRIAVMYGGRVVGVVDRDDADVEQIGLMMSGARV